MMTLADFTLHTAIASLRFASTIKCAPFKLNSTNEISVQPLQKAWERGQWYLATTTIFCHGIFQIVTFTDNVWTNGLNKDSAPHFFFLALALIPMLLFGNAFWKEQGTVNHINCITTLARQSKVSAY